MAWTPEHVTRAPQLPIVALCAALLAGCGHVPRALDGATLGIDTALRLADAESERTRSAESVRGARDVVAHAVDLSPDQLSRTSYIRAVRSGDLERAARVRAVWFPPPNAPKVTVASIRFALANRDFGSARSLAWAAVSRMAAHRPAMTRLWYTTWTEDDVFFPANGRARELDPAIDRISWLGGGSTLTFRLVSGDTTVRAFKPTQLRYQSSPRGEIAAYRLCSLIHCGFEIPHNDEVRISRTRMLELNGRDDARAVADFDRRYSDLIWFEEGDERWLHGASEAWVPEYREFGIEFTDHWHFLVDGDAGRVSLAAVEIEDVLRPVFNTRGRRRDPSAGDTGDLDGVELARQLSNLHVFDFLLNNWDRYSRRYPGANTHWHRDHIISIDNGAAFPRRGTHHTLSGRVERRTSPVRVFSRRTIDAIRWMQPTAVFPILFPPSPHFDEKTEFSQFLDRRKMLLARVDEIVAEHGEERVFILD